MDLKAEAVGSESEDEVLVATSTVMKEELLDSDEEAEIDR